MSEWGNIKGWSEKSDITKTVIETKALKRYNKNYSLLTFIAKRLGDIAPIPKEGEQYLIITEKQFNAFALIVGLIENNIIDEMYLAIYRINEPTVQALINFIEEGKIKMGVFVISNFFNQTKKPERWAIMLRDYCKKNENFKHIYTHNHAKVLAIRTGNDHFVFEGSGNMSDNARIEQYRYENCKESFLFHKKWMSEIS